jgi:predicted Zn-dependent protease
MVDAGYHPQAMITMFEKLLERYKHEPGRLEKLFLTHPPTEERIGNLKAMLVSTSLPEDLRTSSPEFDEIKIRISELYPTPQPDEDWQKEKDEEDEEEPSKGAES